MLLSEHLYEYKFKILNDFLLVTHIFFWYLSSPFLLVCIVTCCLCLYLGAKDRYWSESTICENVINWILSWLLSEPETFKGFLDFFRSNMIMLLFNTSRKGIWRSLLRRISAGRNMAVFFIVFYFHSFGLSFLNNQEITIIKINVEAGLFLSFWTTSCIFYCRS